MMSGNIYKDENGRYYSDLYDEPTTGTISVVYILSPSNDPEGEPNLPITAKIEIANPITEKEKRMRPYRFEYMMLSRMQMDCNYYTTKQQFDNAHATTWEQHIQKMKELWQKFPEDLKPEWCSWEKILEYENQFSK